MEVTAKLRYLRQSPRKVRLVTNFIRGLETKKALNHLTFLNKRATKPAIKLIQSAIANAEHNFSLNPENLYIKTITVDEGPTLKKWRARAFGRAAQIRKRTSHITVILDEIKPQKVQKTPPKDINIQKEKKVKIIKNLEEIKKETPKTEKQVQKPVKKIKVAKKPELKQQGKFKGFVKKVFARKSG